MAESKSNSDSDSDSESHSATKETMLSIDVGMKNLGYCLFEIEKKGEHISKYTLLQWDVINLCIEKPHICGANEIKKNKQVVCGKAAKYTKHDTYVCKKHAVHYAIPSATMEPTKLKKQKIVDLHDLASQLGITYTKPILKTALLELIQHHIDLEYYAPIKQVRATQVDLIALGRAMKTKFDKCFADANSNLKKVIIENQISPIANRMKTLQGMITQYFIMRSQAIIEYVSSNNKLKQVPQAQDVSETHEGAHEGDETKYSDRKKMGIQITKTMMETNDMLLSWKSMFMAHKKKDDLADAFLQGLYYIYHK